MGITELILLSFGLAMDAFSVSVCKGLSMKKIDYTGGIATAGAFGIFQAGMPLIGYFLGSRFETYITSVSHWIAFLLLGIIGGKMLVEAMLGDETDAPEEYHLHYGELLILALATSIDALAVGIVFAAAEMNLLLSVSVIGIITFLLSFAGIIIGNRFGGRLGEKAEIAGGVILILIGVKLLLEGLGIL